MRSTVRTGFFIALTGAVLLVMALPALADLLPPGSLLDRLVVTQQSPGPCGTDPAIPDCPSPSPSNTCGTAVCPSPSPTNPCGLPGTPACPSPSPSPSNPCGIPGTPACPTPTPSPSEPCGLAGTPPCPSPTPTDNGCVGAACENVPTDTPGDMPNTGAAAAPLAGLVAVYAGALALSLRRPRRQASTGRQPEGQ